MSCTPYITPINTLPPEILTHVFFMISSDQPCHGFRQPPGRTLDLQYPTYPELLTKVCSLWRHIVIACPVLWAHIDIALNHPLNLGLLARARACVARAGTLPLDVHISDVASDSEHRNWSDELECRRANSRGLANSQGLVSNSLSSKWDRSNSCRFEFLDDYRDPTVPIRSLELDIVVFGNVKDYHLEAITYVLARCRPGVFNRYTTRIRNEDYDCDHIQFIKPIDDLSIAPRGYCLTLPSEFLERNWLQTRILRINGLCPPWSSWAYHGLIELYIGKGVPELHQSQLAGILMGSPKLRELHLSVSTVGDFQPPVPILLEDLEILSLKAGSWFSMGPGTDWAAPSQNSGKILQLITPGSKPLQFTYFGSPGDSLVDFMSRSNVTHLFIKARGGYDMVPIIRQCTELQTLILEDCGVGERPDLNLGIPNCKEVKSEADGGSTPATRINTLYLAGFRQHCDGQLRGIVERYSVRRLVISGTYNWHEGKSPNSNSEEIESRLSAITMCPTVQFLDWEGIPLDYNV